MKQAVSISIGSSKRNKSVDIEVLGEKVHLERIGTDGDMHKAARLYEELDGKVDAFGVGGTDLGLMVDGRYYRLHSVKMLVQNVKQTPIVDGTGLKGTLERQAACLVDSQLSSEISTRKALVTTAVDRWGLAQGFAEAGYDMVYGDFMFSLGLPVPVYSQSALRVFAALVIPLVSRLPFHWVYPVGQAQEKRTPKWEKFFRPVGVVLGDCHYIRRYMPEDMHGKIVVTNTTTPADVEIFRRAGVRFLVTTTPVLDGRSFGTNMMEACLVAASGRKEPVNYSCPGNYFEWIGGLVKQLDMKPQIQIL